MSDIRRNGIVGVIEVDGLSKVSLHFSEWWNGEGMDFQFNDEDKRISLHIDELRALATAALATGFIDLDEIAQEVQDINESAIRRQHNSQEYEEYSTLVGIVP